MLHYVTQADELENKNLKRSRGFTFENICESIRKFVLTKKSL